MSVIIGQSNLFCYLLTHSLTHLLVKEMESVPGMLLISPQAVMFEPTDFQSPPADDEVTAAACDDAAQRDCIIVPMDSISSIMISHNCAAAASTRSFAAETFT